MNMAQYINDLIDEFVLEDDFKNVFKGRLPKSQILQGYIRCHSNWIYVYFENSVGSQKKIW